MEFIVAPVLFILLILYVAYPLLREKLEVGSAEREMTEMEKLQLAKEEVVGTLKDIDMDYRMGKLSDQDYENLKAQHELEAVEVLQQIERLEKKQSRKTS